MPFAWSIQPGRGPSLSPTTVTDEMPANVGWRRRPSRTGLGDAVGGETSLKRAAVAASSVHVPTSQPPNRGGYVAASCPVRRGAPLEQHGLVDGRSYPSRRCSIKAANQDG